MTTYNAMLLESCTQIEGSSIFYSEITEQVPEGGSPGVASVTVIDEVTIRVTFDYPAVDNSALRSVNSYSITPTLRVYAVTPEDVDEPSYVDLTIDEMDTGTTYTLYLIRLEQA